METTTTQQPAHGSVTLKTCRACGRELELSQFSLSRYGNPKGVCRECVAAKRSRTLHTNRINMGGGNLPPFSDPDFDGKDPGEVVRMMGRAKRWLESRGYEITLKGQYKEVKIKDLKFQ